MIRVSINGFEKVSEEIQCLENNRREMKDVLNRAAKKAQQRLADDIKGRFMITKKEVEAATSRRSAVLSNLTAELRVKGNARELGDYKVSPFRVYSAESGKKRPSVIKAKVYRAGDLKSLEKDGLKAFVTEFKNGNVSNGHKAVVQRVLGETYSNPKERAERASKHWDLTKIRSLYSVSIPQLATQRDVRNEVDAVIWKTIRENAAQMLFGKLKG